MAVPAVRRRYAYPSADLVTLNPGIDLFIDRVVAPAHRNRVRLGRQVEKRRDNIIILGFPRSGNTFLAAWLLVVVSTGMIVANVLPAVQLVVLGGLLIVAIIATNVIYSRTQR